MPKLQAMHPLNSDGGTSQEQGTYHNPAEIQDLYLPEPIPNMLFPTRGLPTFQAPKTAPATKVSDQSRSIPQAIFQSTEASSSKVSTTLQAVLKGNLRQEVKRGSPTIFPMNASHANNPQKNPKKSYKR
jgi:hypothetical protein